MSAMKANKIKMPKSFVVLDLETAEKVKDFKYLRNVQIAMVGTSLYKLKGKKYVLSEMRVFTDFQINQKTYPIKELKKYLLTYGEFILGYNLFDFDYRLLNNHFNLKGIVEKSVDLFMLLNIRNSYHVRGLSLNNLARINLKKTKNSSGLSIPEKWNKQKYSEVVAYNKQDLNLTKLLWEKWLKNRFLQASKNKVDLILADNEDSKFLTGKKSILSHKKWTYFLKNNTRFIQIYYPLGIVVENLNCKRCSHSIHVFAKQVIYKKRAGHIMFSNTYDVFCPKCKAFVGHTSFQFSERHSTRNQSDFESLKLKMIKKIRRNSSVDSLASELNILDSWQRYPFIYE